MKVKNYILAAILAASIPASMYGQQDSMAQDKDIMELSLEDLMNISITSASRTEEKLFDAPLSSFVITRKEIMNAGITALPEAMRLCPGLVVKQMYNGVYDVGIRGFEGLPDHNSGNSNTTLLVMIDNRPVFDYSYGGAFWQNLPVDIIDVEKIEVVLGPSSPLYGPNAVTGVINIITRNTEKDGVNAAAHIQAGVPNTYIGQAWLGYQVNPKLNVNGSVNYQYRKRTTLEFFDDGLGDFITDFNQSSYNDWKDPAYINKLFPHPDQAINKLGGNLAVNYKPAKDVDLHLTGGFTESYALYGFNYYAPVCAFSNSSRYGMIKGNVKGFSFLGSAVGGTQKYDGNIDAYSYLNVDGYMDYNIKVTDKFSLRPAVNIQTAAVNDEKYTALGYSGFYNGKKDMYNIGLSLKGDYTLGKFRFIGALRGDKFKYPDEWYMSYQGIVNFKPNERNIFRAVTARSNSGSYMDDTYLNMLIAYVPPSPSYPYTILSYLEGSTTKKLQTNRMYELGYRGKISDNLQVDVAFFNQVMDNFTASIKTRVEVDTVNLVRTSTNVITDLDLVAVQNGATLSLNFVLLNNKLSIRPFVTYQKTQLLHYSPYYELPAVAQDPDYTTETQKNVEGKTTPNVYGGFYANYAPTEKWNLNLNGYFMSSYMLTTWASTYGPRPYKEFDASYLNGKFILNARVGYQLTPNFNVFASVRNALNANGREFIYTEKATSMYMGGINFTY